MLTNINNIHDKIISLRGRAVLLDRDLAVFYGVETRDINKAVKNNPDKFPRTYVIELNDKEKRELVENFHRFNGLKHTKINPKAFTEKGLYMLATILKSKQATETTILIIETFAKLRALQQTVTSASAATGDRKENLLKKSGELMADLLDQNLTETNVTATASNAKQEAVSWEQEGNNTKRLLRSRRRLSLAVDRRLVTATANPLAASVTTQKLRAQRIRNP